MEESMNEPGLSIGGMSLIKTIGFPMMPILYLPYLSVMCCSDEQSGMKVDGFVKDGAKQ